MSRPGRPLTPAEAELWARVAQTITPLDGRKPVAEPVFRVAAKDLRSSKATAPAKPPSAVRVAQTAKPQALGAHGLDTGWDRKLSRGLIDPDFTLDLHGCSLDAAHGRLVHGLSQAKALGARLVLLVTGKPRPVDAADRGQRRGAIRAKVVDWLAASEHATDIAAIRGAHRRHGGQGALYIVLKRRRG